MSTNGFGRWWGPVFEAERITRARRWQGYVLRSLFVLTLLLGLLAVGRQLTRPTGAVTVREMAQVGASLFTTLAFVELIAALLIAPATTAGAICLDKSQGSLAHLFVTDLSNREIILGKLAARLLPTWGLLACAFPVAALATMLGGIDPVALVRAYLVVLAVAFLGCTFALMLSVRASRPQEVIITVYAAWAIWVLDWPAYELVTGSGWPPGWIKWTNPFYLTLGYLLDPSESFTGPAIAFALGCLGLGTACTGVAIRQVRAVACRSPRSAVKPGRGAWRGFARLTARLPRWRGPDLDANPVLWREWHRNRPTPWSRRIWLGFEVLSAVTGVYLIAGAWFGAPRPINEAPGILLAGLVNFGLLLVAAAVAGVLAEERTRGSLDVLLAAPMTTRTILWAKWRGAFRPIPRLAVWPLAVGLAYATALPLRPAALGLYLVAPASILAMGAALVSLGLALATWLRRPGQATAWTIAGLMAAVIGWLVVGATFRLTPDVVTPAIQAQLGYVFRRYVLFLGSPFMNVAAPTTMACSSDARILGEAPGVLAAVATWTVAYALAAWGLFELTARTFDRCLGRAPEGARVPRLAPGGAARSGAARPRVEPVAALDR